MDEIKIKKEPIYGEAYTNDNNIKITIIKEEILTENIFEEPMNSKKKCLNSKTNFACNSAEIKLKTIKEENSEETTSNKQRNSSNKSSIEKKKPKRKTKILKCKMCNYTSRQKHILKDHIAKHTGKKTYYCDDCGYSCERQYRMMEHLRTHTGEKPYSCKYCDYKCRRKELLTTHLKKHTGEKVFCCDICGYKTLNKHRLREHIRIHTGEKPFVCHLCNFKSAYENSLNNHLKKHVNLCTEDGDTSIDVKKEKKDLIEIEIDLDTADNLRCDICNYETNNKSNLIKHISRHFTKYHTCKYCTFKTKNLNYLKYVHTKMHTGDTPFACQFCEYKAVLKSQLLRHIVKHMDGEKYKKKKPFGCLVCGFKCSNKLRLTAHVKIHDNEVVQTSKIVKNAL